VFNLFITTGNKGLIEVVEIVADYFDNIVKQHVDAKIQGSYKFNFDFQKFISEPKYNFYDILVKNCGINLKWNIWELFSSLRDLAMKGNAFKELNWSPMD
jgi:hypothetical protein